MPFAPTSAAAAARTVPEAGWCPLGPGPVASVYIHSLMNELTNRLINELTKELMNELIHEPMNVLVDDLLTYG